MPQPSQADPFLTRPAPRCLTRRTGLEPESPVGQSFSSGRDRTLRAALRAWAARLLNARSRNAA